MNIIKYSLICILLSINISSKPVENLSKFINTYSTKYYDNNKEIFNLKNKNVNDLINYFKEYIKDNDSYKDAYEEFIKNIQEGNDLNYILEKFQLNNNNYEILLKKNNEDNITINISDEKITINKNSIKKDIFFSTSNQFYYIVFTLLTLLLIGTIFFFKDSLIFLKIK